MKVLVVKQPWAYLIVHALKPVENRSWYTAYRGPVLIQASKHRRTRRDWAAASEFCSERGVSLPTAGEVDYGGVIGLVEQTDCVSESSSPWFEGPFGHVYADARRLPFVQAIGNLGLYAPGKPLIADLLANSEWREQIDSILNRPAGCRCPANRCLLHPEQSGCSLRLK